jgi:hypothetical protein
MVENLKEWKWSSYGATAGLKNIPDFLAVNWILRLFSSNKQDARKQYRKFVYEGMQKGSPWEDLQGQILLGEEGFIDKFKEHLTDKEKIKEIPRAQRYVSRPVLSKLFSRGETATKRNKHIHDAHMKHGYTLKEIADHIGIHYTTVSKVVKGFEKK